MPLRIDPNRLGQSIETGIFIRAKGKNGKFQTVDISELDSQSLLEWLRSDGNENPLAENTVGILLGHGTIV